MCGCQFNVDIEFAPDLRIVFMLIPTRVGSLLKHTANRILTMTGRSFTVAGPIRRQLARPSGFAPLTQRISPNNVTNIAVFNGTRSFSNAVTASTTTGTYPEIREAVRALCSDFPHSYWDKVDEAREYPTEFVNALQEAGYLSILIPEEYGGSGLPLSAACAVLEEIHASGGNGGAAHAQMYTMGTFRWFLSKQQ